MRKARKRAGAGSVSSAMLPVARHSHRRAGIRAARDMVTHVTAELAILSGMDLTHCGWAGEDPLYIAYHDEEWGVPEYDDRALYEKLILDGFQAGLSWITILRKR